MSGKKGKTVWQACCLKFLLTSITFGGLLIVTDLIFFWQTTKCDSVFQIILSSMEFESKIAMRRVSCHLTVYTCTNLSFLSRLQFNWLFSFLFVQAYASHLNDFIEHMGITILRHFKVHSQNSAIYVRDKNFHIVLFCHFQLDSKHFVTQRQRRNPWRAVRLMFVFFFSQRTLLKTTFSD